MPDALIVEDGRLAGLRFRRTRAEAGKVIPTDETFERRGPYVISSIGSIPLPIEGIETRGELFRFTDWDLGRLEGFPTVFSAGNIVTGKGNIIASRKHAKRVSQIVAESFLGLANDGHAGEAGFMDAAHDAIQEAASGIAAEIQAQPKIGDEALAKVRSRVAERQRAVGYDGDFKAWIEKVTPPDLE
jgi:hypothetical protein